MNLSKFIGESVLLYLSKILIYKFYNDYMTPKWSKKP